MKIQENNITNEQSNSSKRKINNKRINEKRGFEDINNDSRSKPDHKKSKLILITLIISIIIVIALVVICIYFIKKNPEKKEKTVENIDEEQNYITATYQVKEGQEIKAFNPSSVGLGEDDYSIYEIEEISNTLRRLKEKNKKNGHVFSEKTGLMKLKIKFHKNLTSLDYMFESCEDLISIDMSHIETRYVTSMIYAFTGCKKMEKINLTSINTSAVELMDFLFAGCNNLIDINGLETLDTFSLKKTAGMFLDCNSLVFANLSSFQINNVEEQNGMFINNPNLKIVDLSNCSDANQIFSPEEHFDIVIKGNEDINVTNLNGFFKIQKVVEIVELNCTIGSEEKCLECNNKKGEKINCKSCNDGYYLPLGKELTKTKCKKCDEGCNMCYANPGEDLSICILCNDTYQLYEGKCIKNCEIGENEKCMECDDGKQGFNDRCKKCNPGYYYDLNYNKSICQKIDIDNCIEAEMVSNYLRCLKCSKSFMLYENLCFKACDEGENEKCASCNNIFDYREYCSSCNSGYYINNFNPTKCQSCFKNSSYYYNYTYLINSQNYSFLNMSEIFLKEALQNVSLDNNFYNILENNQDLIIKEKDITYEITTTFNQKINEYKNISIISLGECEIKLREYYELKENVPLIILKVDIYKERLSVPIVYFKVFDQRNQELNLTICRDIKIDIMFPVTIDNIETSNCKECDLISGKLYCTFCEEGYVLINNRCFKDCNKSCENCYFDGINNGRCIKCKEEYLLKSFDYNFDSYCVPCPTGCKFCYDLIDINVQEESDIYEVYYTDYYYDNDSDIVYSSEYTNNYLSDQIYYDNKYCNSCIEGYNLVNNLCQKQCDIGKEEKCLKCEANTTNRCSSCNPKYYLDKLLGTCHKCGENNCLICDEKTCFDCENGYELISNKCYKTCEKGINEKCKECKNINSNNKGECESCNQGFYLPSDSMDKSKCFPCSFACLSCYGNTTTSICTSCKENFILSRGKCKIDFDGDDDEPEEKKCPPPYVLSGGFCMEKCSVGPNDKCYSCNDEELKIDQCKECNSGYFLPTDSDKKKCEICGAFCLKCEGTKLNNQCLECQYNYMLFEGRCVKNCEIGNNDKCKKCLETPGNNFRCESCNDGYYLPEFTSDINYHNSKCQKCPENCEICSGKYNEPICSKCNDGYILKDRNCIEGCDIIKLKNNCKTCDDYDENGVIAPKCTECSDGYFFPDEEFEKGINKCIKCNYVGCNKCKGNINNNTCIECISDSQPLVINNEIKSCYNTCDFGPDEKCKSCSNEINKCYSCNEGYELKEGNCVLKYYTFSAIYITTNKNETVRLMNNYNTIVKMEVDGKIYDYPSVYFRFENPGEHKVNIRLGEYSFADLFYRIGKLKKIIFWDNFDSTRISYMNYFFAYCSDLEYADLSRLNLKNNGCFMNFFKDDRKLKEAKFPKISFNNIYWFYGMFEGCESITSVDLSSAYNDNGYYFYNMFKGCKNLKKINLKNFRKKPVSVYYYAYDIFEGVPENGELIINSNFYESIKSQIPKTWTINITE